MIMNPDGISLNTIQASSYILVYENKENDFNINVLKEKLITEGCKYFTLDAYCSNYELQYSLDMKNLYPKNIEYYYIYLVFSSRQKLQEDSVTKNVVYPRYYKYNDRCFPKVLEKNPSFNNKQSVLYMLRIFRDENKASLLAHLEASTSGLNKTNLEYHFWQILSLETEEQFYTYVKEHNLYYFLDNLFSKYRTLQFFNTKMSSIDGNLELHNIPDYLNSYLQSSMDIQKSKPFLTTSKNVIESKPLPMMSPHVMKELEDSTLTLNGEKQAVFETLEKDVYKMDIAIKIFYSENVFFSPILDDIVREKFNNSPDPSKEGNGYKFLFYEKRFLKTTPYRVNNPNRGLCSIFLYFSNDNKKKYLKYLPNDEKVKYPDIQ